ncbi:phosphopentomutase [Thalassotalea sp. HSM 43]|uniref:phosphopentomutase n=1 Tax=Thalassotalea sp. HSM 43 TaxID=2552945 RepID=UPI0010803248|nr:phosphopentomutase [Thalassotalea sp. HSM 43]QBY05922.1 phosphopentomutase [Thalassotalea sp. HSM 43]
MARVLILVIDGFGLGAAPDAKDFGDIGANTFANLADEFYEQSGRKLDLPTLSKLGLISAATAAGNKSPAVNAVAPLTGAYGYAAEISSGKDTPSGHWEMMGVPVLFDWGYFADKENSFSEELLTNVYKKTGIQGSLGNCHSSGTTIIAELGEEHMKTGIPICYTSADSVFQVAAHEETFGLDNLHKYCEQVRELLNEMDLNIGRVIARPFIGSGPDDFERTGNRRDYSILPPAPTVLDKIVDAGGKVVSVGKIADIFAHQGISEKYKATGLEALVDTSIEQLQNQPDNTLIFTNLVNFDQDYGHRRDPVGYGKALEYLDQRLTDIGPELKDDDYVVLTADHGCDPTWHGSDHTREYVPVIFYKRDMPSINLGESDTFADIGATVADIFGVSAPDYGKSLAAKLG